MKKVVQVVETGKSVWEALMGKRVLLMANYFYEGDLVGVNDDSVLLENPIIVYSANDFQKYSDSAKLPCKELYVLKSQVEAFFEKG